MECGAVLGATWGRIRTSRGTMEQARAFHLFWPGSSGFGRDEGHQRS